MIFSDESTRRFMERVDKQAEGCWLWVGARLLVGYGSFYFKGSRIAAHRFAYIVHKGSIPAGLVIDHLCRNRLCVNPDHLEAVTNRENILRGDSPSARQARQTTCRLGHPLSGSNLYLTSTGRRHCRTCTYHRNRARRHPELANPPF